MTRHATRTAICTFFSVSEGPQTRKYTQLAPLSLSAWKAFGKRTEIDVLNPGASSTKAWDACWEKLRILLETLQDFDQVLWVDCDTIPIVKEAPGWLTLPAHYDIVVQCPEDYGARLGWSKALSWQRIPFNSGVMLLRSTPRVRQLLEAAYAMRKQSLFRDVWTGIGEQEALWQLITDGTFSDLSIGYARDMQCHPAHPGPTTLCAHLYGDHSTPLFGEATCRGVFEDWETSIRKNQPAQTSLALLHWCAIQRTDPNDTVDRGGPERFLYAPTDFEIPVGECV